MKLVIHTQIRENYGAHDWDGQGECPQRWKCKGGNTYVVLNLTENQIDKIVDGGIPTITSLISEDNDYYNEYVLSHSIVDNDDTPWDEWETPIVLSWGGDRWLAEKTVENDEFGYMRPEIARKREEWIPQPGGERAHFQAIYQMSGSSDWIPHKDLSKALEAA